MTNKQPIELTAECIQVLYDKLRNGGSLTRQEMYRIMETNGLGHLTRRQMAGLLRTCS